MLFAIRPSRRALLAELSLALSIPPHKSGNAVETHVLLDSTVGVGRISLQATNFDESFESTFNAQVDVLGRVALPTRKLHDYLRQLPDGDITISASEPHVIIVRSGRSSRGLTRMHFLLQSQSASRSSVSDPKFWQPCYGELDSRSAPKTAATCSNACCSPLAQSTLGW